MAKSISASAFGKVILFGEHPVVYGRPAIAVPVTQVHTEAKISFMPNPSVVIDAADIGRHYVLRDAAPDDPIATITRLVCDKLGVEPKNFSIHIHSTIPVARGLGSGAAVSVAIARALAKYFLTTEVAESTAGRKKISPPSQVKLTNEVISALAYEVEKLHHGTPSGIDNTVIALERPVYFQRDHPVETFRVSRPFLIAIGDTGIASPTKIAVGDVRHGWEKERDRYERIFDEIGVIARDARVAIERGDVTSLGSLMLKNQDWLKQIGVSSPEIEELVDAAVGAGAEGAKLSGAGRGGNVIALVDEETRAYVERAMKRAGAKRVIVTEIK